MNSYSSCNLAVNQNTVSQNDYCLCLSRLGDITLGGLLVELELHYKEEVKGLRHIAHFLKKGINQYMLEY